jgi:RimJ/RimL family protein N-acetyltransferase
MRNSDPVVTPEASPGRLALETTRLLLRPPCPADFEAIHAYAADAEVTRYMSFGPNTPEETREFLARCEAERLGEPRADYTFAITLKESGRLVGSCGMMVDSSVNRRGEIGFCLHAPFWGRGYAPEAAEALLEFGFRELDLHRVFARCHPDNRASARVQEKIGMRYEGCLRESSYVKGTWWSWEYRAILSHEWRARRGATGEAL